jgi:hypothetical protein
LICFYVSYLQSTVFLQNYAPELRWRIFLLNSISTRSYYIFYFKSDIRFSANPFSVGTASLECPFFVCLSSWALRQHSCWRFFSIIIASLFVGQPLKPASAWSRAMPSFIRKTRVPAYHLDLFKSMFFSLPTPR